MRINWGDAAVQHQYEDLVAVLLQLLNPDAVHIEGAGGDEGRDVILKTASGLVIFECKRFADRLTDTRKDQIRRSLKRAASHEPVEWHLVVPINPTPAEERFFRRLQKKYEFPIFWRGRTWLDAQMANHPVVARYFLEGAKEELLELLKDLPIATQQMKSAADAVPRLEQLHRRLNELDIHYEYALSTGGAAEEPAPDRAVLSVHAGAARIDVIPRYRGALDARPIHGAFTVTFGTEDADVRDAFLRAMDFGDAVELPPRTVESFTLDAPGGLGGDLSDGGLRIEGLTQGRSKPLPVQARVLSADGTLLQALALSMTGHRRGSKGGTLYGGDSTNQLQAELRYNGQAGTATMNLAYRPRPLPPAAVRPVAAFLAAFEDGDRLELAVGSPPRRAFGTELAPARPSWPTWFLDLAAAFEKLQQRVRATFDMPSDLTEYEAREVLELAEELDPAGRRYTWTELNLTVRELPDRQGLDLLLSDTGGALMVLRDLAWEFRGQLYELGLQRLVFEHIIVDDLGDVRERLAARGETPVRLIPGRSADGVARLLEPDDPSLAA